MLMMGKQLVRFGAYRVCIQLCDCPGLFIYLCALYLKVATCKGSLLAIRSRKGVECGTQSEKAECEIGHRFMWY